MHQTLGSTEARERFPDLVRDAERRGHTTLITRRGSRTPVAAVVPAHVAEANTRPAPAPALPSAQGGTFAPGQDGQPDEAERAWTGAALAGAQHHLSRVITEAASALAALAAAQAAHAGGDTEGARHQLAAAGVERTLARLGGAEMAALDLYYALTDPGPLACEVCGHGLTRSSDGQGWVHVEPDGRAQLDVDHETIPHHRPPARPDIADGSVVRAS